jgi:hypothetical protein
MSKELAIAIIEGCKHGSVDQTPCKACIHAAEVVIGYRD